jgi:transcriptional regulator with AAA-type ATPase domain
MLRIRRSSNGEVLFALSGRIGSEHVAELESLIRAENKPIDLIPDEVMTVLQAHDWPGNIRELQNVIERSVIVSETQTFSVDESWLSRRPSSPDLSIQPNLFSRSLLKRRLLLRLPCANAEGAYTGPQAPLLNSAFRDPRWKRRSGH